MLRTSFDLVRSISLPRSSSPKGPCTHIVYIGLYKYFGAKVDIYIYCLCTWTLRVRSKYRISQAFLFSWLNAFCSRVFSVLRLTVVGFVALDGVRTAKLYGIPKTQRHKLRTTTFYSRSQKVGNPIPQSPRAIVGNPIPQSPRAMFRESQHYLALIRFSTLWGLL